MADAVYIDVVLPTYRVEPEENDRFYPSVAKAIADKVLEAELSGQTYDEEEARNWSLNISDSIRQQIQEKMSKTRYKIVVQTTIGQQSDQAIRVASRCLWDPSVDNYASSTYSNETIFAHSMIFCLYTD
jgi:hypothetical protein